MKNKEKNEDKEFVDLFNENLKTNLPVNYFLLRKVKLFYSHTRSSKNNKNRARSYVVGTFGKPISNII